MMLHEDNIQLDAVIPAIVQIDEFVDFPFSVDPPARQDDILTTAGAATSISLVATPKRIDLLSCRVGCEFITITISDRANHHKFMGRLLRREDHHLLGSY